MSAIEEAVKSLNGAIDALEAKIADRLADFSHQSDAIDAARRQARAARVHTGAASEQLADAITDLKALVDDGDEDEG
ncbi:MAG: hypothetical protein WD076_06450 [Parvularculaceae bacterium]